MANNKWVEVEAKSIDDAIKAGLNELNLEDATQANINILKWAKRNIKKPIVAIGGIKGSNYKKFIKFGAKYIAISSYIWDNPKLKPEIAIRKFK